MTTDEATLRRALELLDDVAGGNTEYDRMSELCEEFLTDVGYRRPRAAPVPISTREARASECPACGGELRLTGIQPSPAEFGWMRDHGRSPTGAEFAALKESRERVYRCADCSHMTTRTR